MRIQRAARNGRRHPARTRGRLRGRTFLATWILAFALPASAQATTFFVNRTDDPTPGAVGSVCNNVSAADTSSSCSFREAVVKANSVNAQGATSGPTVQVAAGTYQLRPAPGGATGENDQFNNTAGELDVEANMNIVGAGSGSTFVQSGTTGTATSNNGTSLIFIVNGYTLQANSRPLQVGISGLDMRFGNNKYDSATWGFGGALEFDSADGGRLTLSGDLFDRNVMDGAGDGGAIAAFNISPSGAALSSPNSLLSISNSAFTNNSVSTNLNVVGGAVAADDAEPVQVSGSSFSGNTLTVTGAARDGEGGGIGGLGRALSSLVTGAANDSITNSTFSNNSAFSRGGGVSDQRPITVSGSSFANNSVPDGTGGGLQVQGGGTSSVTGSTFVGNTVATTGNSTGGGAIENLQGTLNLTNSRITGNTGSPGSGVDEGTSAGSGNTAILNATEDWWGCNGGSGASGCDTATREATGAGSSLTTSPFVTLRTTASPTTILAGGASTLTASFLKDSAGTTLSTSQISELSGLPVAWTAAAHGTFSNQQTTIQPGGTATATLTNDNTCNATSGQSKVDNVQTGDALAAVTLTTQCPDLTVDKTDDVTGRTSLGNQWTWKLHVANRGAASGSFASGATVVTDDLPESGLTYGTTSVANATGVSGTGTLSCAISSNTLTCTASGGSVLIAAPGSFDVTFTATPSATGTFVNPRTSGTCAVDPGGAVPESNETNNTCSDSVVVTAPDLTIANNDDAAGATTLGNSWNWKLQVSNGGNGDATFASGQTVLTDDLPTANVTYGTPSISGETGIAGTGTLACSIAADTLTCTASGGTVVVGSATGAFDVSVAATPSTTGTFANPRSAGACSVDPSNAVAESSETNNACNSDTVAVSAPDLTATKTDDVGGATTIGNTFTWKIHIANSGDAPATFATGQIVLHDDLPSTATYGTPQITNAGGLTGLGIVSCTVTGDLLTCAPAGGPGTIPAGASFDVSVTATPTSTGVIMNPTSGGTCSVDPGNQIAESDEMNNACSDSVTVTGADLTATAGDDVGGATTLGNPWTWTLHVANQGVSDASFADGQTVLSDDLPAGASYGAAQVSHPTGLTGAANLSCSIAANTLTCKAAGGSVTLSSGTSAFDVSTLATPARTGTFANPPGGGTCAVDPANVIPETDEANNSCGDTVTVTAPDLTAVKTDDVSGTAMLGGHWTWSIRAENVGNADATFADGTTILTDDLPNANVSYGNPAISGATGITGAANIDCSISDGDVLTCQASGGPVTLANGTGAFSVSFTATPSAAGTYANPRAGGTCSLDPSGVVTESDTSNNACSDAVRVTAPDLTATETDDVSGATRLGTHWIWKVHVANTGNGPATFASGVIVLRDDLPTANLAYGAVNVSNSSGVSGTGTLSCSVASGAMTCIASGGTVIIGASGEFDVAFMATPGVPGTFANPRPGGACSVDPDGMLVESSTTNNSCSDTVTVTAPDLSASATDDVGGATTLGHSWNWMLHVANGGTAGATFASGQTVLQDDLPATTIAYGSVSVSGAGALSGSGTLSCSIAASTLTCTAAGGSVTIAPAATFDVSFTATPSAGGRYATPRSGGVCTVDPAAVTGEFDSSNNVCHDTVNVSDAPTVALTTPPDGAVYNLGQSVRAAYTCAATPGGSGLRSCSGTVPDGTAINTATTGMHTFAVTATNDGGLSTTVVHTYTVVGPPTAIISSPATGLAFKRGQSVSTSFSCRESGGGPGLSACSDSNGASAPAGRLDTSRNGTFTYVVTAVSKDGQRGTASIVYRVAGGRPDNRFTVFALHVRRDGSAQFTTATHSAGQIDVLETAWRSNEVVRDTTLLQPAVHRFVFARAHVRTSHGGKIVLGLRPDRRGIDLVKNHHYVVQIRLWITFTPKDGTPRSRGFYGLFVTR